MSGVGVEIRRLWPVLVLAAASSAAAPPPARDDAGAGLERLQRELARFEALAGGQLGVGVWHAESGAELYLRGDEPFPMASTFKVAVAVELLRGVDRGEVELDEMIALEPSDLHPGSGTLAQLFDDPGVVLSLRNLLELMLLISDNSATDLVLRRVGGGSAVTRMLESQGIHGLRIDRSTVDLIAAWVGLEGEGGGPGFDLAEFARRQEALSTEAKASAAEKFRDDGRDTSSPRAMAGLLRGVLSGDLLSERSRGLLLEIMGRCETGENRLRGLLPPETKLAHKTGTIGGTTNDVGILDLPDGAGRVVGVVLVKNSDAPIEQRERAIAHIGRAVYDYFLFAR